MFIRCGCLGGGSGVTKVIIEPDESFESALKRFKKQCEKAGLLSEFKKRQHYEKPSVRRKRKRSEEHTSELQSQSNLVCRLLLEKKKHAIRSEQHLQYLLVDCDQHRT